MTDFRQKSGFTMLELIMVIAVLAIVSVLAIQRYSGILSDAKKTVAKSDLVTIRDAILTYLNDMETIPYFSAVNPFANLDVHEQLNLSIHNLFVRTNPPVSVARQELDNLQRARTNQYDVATGRGWRGPYLQATKTVTLIHASNQTGQVRDRSGSFLVAYLPDEMTTFEDPWGTPYLIQIPAPTEENFEDAPNGLNYDFAAARWKYARLVSAGPNKGFDTPRDLTAGWGVATNTGPTERGDDIVLFLYRADGYETAPVDWRNNP